MTIKCLVCGGRVLFPYDSGIELQAGETWCRCVEAPMPLDIRPIDGIVPRPIGLDSGKGISMRYLREYDLQADNIAAMNLRYQEALHRYQQIIQRRWSMLPGPDHLGEADENDTAGQSFNCVWTDAEREAYRERQVEAGRRSGRYAWNLTANDKVFLRQRGIAIEEDE